MRKIKVVVGTPRPSQTCIDSFFLRGVFHDFELCTSEPLSLAIREGGFSQDIRYFIITGGSTNISCGASRIDQPFAGRPLAFMHPSWSIRAFVRRLRKNSRTINEEEFSIDTPDPCSACLGINVESLTAVQYGRAGYKWHDNHHAWERSTYSCNSCRTFFPI